MHSNFRQELALTIVALITIQTALAQSPAQTRQDSSIPIDQLGTVARKQYHGDGLSVTATQGGARMTCVFQKLEGEATTEGLWLRSTGENVSNERFRVLATEVGRTSSNGALDFRPRKAGRIELANDLVRFVRAGLTEEYSVSVDGVRQDFVVERRPDGEGELKLKLEVTGARAKPASDGVHLVLDESGRKISYNRLRVTDATGRQLSARIEVTRPDDTALAVLVNDSDAIYPVRVDPTFSDADWTGLGGFPGTDSSISDAVVDASGTLYVAGFFDVAGEVISQGIAKWDGNSWSTLGRGLNSEASVLALSGNNLYVGGSFTIATNTGGAAVTVNRIAKWDGTNWFALGSGLNNTVYALSVSGTNLFAGGLFSSAVSPVVAVSRIARWDGSSWSALGSGMSGSVFDLAASGTNLYAGGSFVTAGGNSVNRMARWDGNSWWAMGQGLSGSAETIAALGTDVYAGGSFIFATNTGGTAVTVNRIAKWDGTNWSTVGGGMNSSVGVLTVSGTDLYVGGSFVTATNIGGAAVTVNNIAKWNGSSWSAYGTGMNNSVSALAISGDVVYAGGFFNAAGGNPVSYAAKWDGTNWAALGSGINNSVRAVAVAGNDVYVGGFFCGLTQAGEALNFIARWDGNSWSPLGSGMDNAVYALAVSGNDLYAGGSFTNAGGVTVNRIAKWNGSTWSPLGLGMSANVMTLLVSGTNLYVGGNFTRATNSGGASVTANGIARWDANGWSALGSGMNNTVYALTMADTNLYAGGFFTFAGGAPAAYIARWDGSVWSPVGGGMNNWVFSLLASDTNLYVGGDFTRATNNGGTSVIANYIARWNGSNWISVGSGMNDRVSALAMEGTNLYAAGIFNLAGGMSAGRIARWDGSVWSRLGSGLSTPVNAMVISGSDLYVGGDFSIAGGKAAAFVAKARIGDAPGRFNNVNYSPAIGFRYTFLDGTTGSIYRIQAATSMPASNWTDVTNFTYNGPASFTNFTPASTNRFYRAITP